MRRRCLILALFAVNALAINAQNTTTAKRSWDVKQAIEVESLVPMFLNGGYHVALGYRYQKFRFRVSVINGGDYDAETAGLNNSSDDFKRYYKTSPGIFVGYNIWRNLETYLYTEFHTFEIEQKATSVKKDLRSVDFGGGIGYQFFIGRCFYIQPALHVYLRNRKTIDFGTVNYRIPGIDISPVLRLGVRPWSNLGY